MSMRPRAPVSTPQERAPLTFDDLTETEKSAASLGVSPEELRPISFLNNAHYESLKASNALSGKLSQQLEAFKTVAAADESIV